MAKLGFNPLQSLTAAIKVFESKKMAVVLLMGFSSGLPFFLTSRTLQAWMTQANVDLTAIGLFSLVALPYSLKFLWSPLLDRYVPPFLGRRRGWLMVTQIGLLLAIAAMGFQNPAVGLRLLAVNALLIAFFSASQDIAVDAYRTDILEELEMGAGAGVYVLGYRIALLVTGSAALILADQMPWPLVYLLISGLMMVGILTTFWGEEPATDVPAPPSLKDAIILPFGEFFHRFGGGKALIILLFVCFYRYGDALIGNMVTPFLLKTGFSQTEIGAWQGGLGLVATIVGVLAGGAIISRIGIHRALWILGFLQALSNLTYFALAQAGQSYGLMILAINVDNFCGGLGVAALTAFLMSLCNPRFSATQYALLSSLFAVSRDIFTAPAGRLAEIMGWPVFFLFTLAAALPALALLPFFAPWQSHEEPPLPRPGQ
ncbi:AmpG family muropeptide MFS transporter [Thermosynechococcaceae cyanobacterium BACA0444]|uniref:AmpG family muropeptide MFS transporter n=1 Tax=Pseudocalidococcus azoricus BACA0444 TaxID=2918990 RepID=A0AAE4FTD7_9CYAN|nr:AmpG family muropeptide MFS transporter [Pseudocalidococcus azoricus]MDS3861890.1 AmpG family muropeptide MFS transporter [Pseudocalidococcus azoricus BACA0444]